MYSFKCPEKKISYRV